MQNETEAVVTKALDQEGMRTGVSNWLKWIIVVFTVIGICITIFYVFGLTFQNQVLSSYAFYYLISAFFFSIAFLVMPGTKSRKIMWFDYLAAILIFVISIYFAMSASDIMLVGWLPASPLNFVLGGIVVLALLEAARRSGGLVFLGVCLVFFCYPLFAHLLPGVLSGKNSTLNEAVSQVMFGSNGILGLPMKTFAEILIGFLIFTGMMIATGAGQTFIDVSLGILGKFRGGSAKVSVVASLLMGTISGSVVSNVLTVGSFTIPAMKRTGFSSVYAGAIEACASTGGVITPPVMGATAFIMAALLNVPYSLICVAAIVPALLYYFGLLTQVDAYAARMGLAGLPPKEIPPLRETLKKGWIFIFVFAFLIWGMVAMKWETETPFYASALLFVLSFIRRDTMMTPKRFFTALHGVGSMIAQAAAILIPIGLIMYALLITGATGAVTSFLISMGAGNVFLIIVIGAVLCYLMGMVGLAAAAYIFLAVTMAPAAITAGHLNPLAVHMFILYYAALAAISPPVAIGAFVAAGISGANPMKTSIQSMKMGVVIYFIPFFFVFNENLILQGSIGGIIYHVLMCIIGVFFLAEGTEGYLIGIGKLKWLARIFVCTFGCLIAFPEVRANIAGVALGVLVTGLLWLSKRRALKAAKEAEVVVE